MGAPELVALAIAAHGGGERFAAAARVRVRLRIGGNILATRFRSPFTRPYEAEIDPRRPHARLLPFHRPGRAGVFDGDRVAIEEDGREVQARVGARAHARGHRVWDELDLLYFLGYALWNYTMTPLVFRWPGVATRELEPWRGLRRLAVEFPESFPTHCREQTFYLDERGHLARLDYVAEVLGSRRGAHLCEEQRSFDGITVPTHRHVRLLRRDLTPRRRLPAAMEGWIDDLTVE